MKIQEQLVKTLSEKGLTVTAAESCTGGLIASMITEISGASNVFECGICSYSNRIKSKLLGVSQRTLDLYTEVSVQTAEEMAQGAQKISGADFAVSTTGVAGPTGGTNDNPVGTVCIGFAVGNNVFSEKKNFNSDGCNDREVIRQRCAEYCLERLYGFVLKTPAKI